MKLILATLLLSTSTYAATLRIDCQFADPEIKDHVLIELLNDQHGTFLYSSQSSDGTTPAKIGIERVSSDQNDTAKFQVSNPEVKFYFLMPKSLLNRASPEFTGGLLTEIPELNITSKQDLKCSSKL